ncbi:MAG: tetratricopeptide repeat protein [Candidatus Aegiribacteria sp.]
MSDTFTGETYTTLCNDAEAYLAKSSPEQARELLQKAISLIGTRPRGRSLLADTCMIMELWSEAREQLEILITLEEGNVNNHFRLAQVLEELGEYQLAADNYQVVLDNDPDHHSASVAMNRITARERDSGVNLAEVFNSRVGEKASEKEESEEAAVEEETEAAEAEEENEPEAEAQEEEAKPEAEEPGEEEETPREGLQIYPDVPSDELFADSRDDEDDDSVDALLKNIGLSGDSTSEDEEADVSALLENIGVTASSALESAFSEPEDADEAEDAAPDDTSAGRGKRVVSLDEIFGTASGEPEEEKPEAEAPEEEEEPAAGEEPEEEIPEEEEEPVVEAEETVPFSAGRTLEDIFKGTGEEPEEEVPEEEEEPEVEEEPEEEVPEEEEEPEVEEEPAAEEEPVTEAAEHRVCVMRNEADYTIDPWSSESGLLTVSMISGRLDLDRCMLSVMENTLQVEWAEESRVSLSGQGTFLLNCGSEEPLRLEVRDNMVIRKEAVVLHTGEIRLELLEIPENEDLFVIKDTGHETVIFQAPRPVRVILLGQNNRVFLVRTSSIMAADPDIVLSGSEDGFTVVSGSGKVYLIE